MEQDTTRERRPPTRYGQKVKPIAVGDEVKARYAKTDDYWLAKVLVVEDDGVTVQWLDEVGPSAPAKVPLGHVRAVGADGGYGDGCSALSGRSVELPPARQSVRKGSGQHHEPGGARLGAGGRHENHRRPGVWGLRRLLSRRENDRDLHL